MNAEVRLAEIVAALEAAGIPCLVMGGHAVRYYGLNRNTIDFDVHVAPRTVSPASLMHLTLVEAVRRQYRLAAQAVDRADKEAEIGRFAP